MIFSKKERKSYIFASILTGIYDVNRNQLLQNDDFLIIRDWYDSVIKLKLDAIIFHNNFSNETVLTYQNEYVSFVKVDYDGILNPNVQRYLIYLDFVNQHLNEIGQLFVTDIADVIILKNPFLQPLFLHNKAVKIFCGDEPKNLENDWMKEHSNHLRNNISGYANYEEKFKNEILLNCGIIGGSIEFMQSLLEELSSIHRTYSIHNKTAYTGDMGAFNYVMRTKFTHKIIHGSPINTEFKGYETENIDCWFKHK